MKLFLPRDHSPPLTAARADENGSTGSWDKNWGLLVIRKGETGFSDKYTGKFGGVIESELKERKLCITSKQTNTK
ncbi:MAG: hypothetical protein AAGC68_13670 [Verrucomicrobiota bacterium]